MQKPKWLIAILSVFLILGVLFMLGKKSVHTEITTSASASKVWQALSSPEKVQEWNTVLIPLEGNLKEGETVKYEFYQEEGGKAAGINAKVIKIDHENEINQRGGIAGILTFNHQYILKGGKTETRIIIHEEYRGLMVPFWNPATVETAYRRLLSQLKNFLENE